MSNKSLIVENVSKQYRLGQVGTGTMTHDFKRWLYKIRGKEDPYSKIGETNDRSKKGVSDYVWALKDINFDVKQGEVLGIIGKNGAGKSTLLKILSRVTSPTTGHIKINGRMASLLEVGTGFHPELTGRENVFLNGAIMGMSKSEIKSKFDEIVDFSGVERYIDTPVKRYSSGMHVRLGFAVAAHLEPEILVIDEVLAVGDAEFQKKCLGKMKAVSGEGRTVLFVSHNMGAIKALCDRGLLLENGTLTFDGNIDECVNRYLSINQSGENTGRVELPKKGFGSGEARINIVEMIDYEGQVSETVLYKEPIKVRIHIDSEISVPTASIDIKISDNNGTLLFHALNQYQNIPFSLNNGKNVVEIEIENNLLPGRFMITPGIHNASTSLTLDMHENAIAFEVIKAAKIASESYPWEWILAPSKINIIKLK
ncbi:MAG: ABC transporter ATP-binding protein [Bacteroidota bacterium]|nr:ABC transporter ATP-binding protein [Bacteroidota bacterium]